MPRPGGPLSHQMCAVRCARTAFYLFGHFSFFFITACAESASSMPFMHSHTPFAGRCSISSSILTNSGRERQTTALSASASQSSMHGSDQVVSAPYLYPQPAYAEKTSGPRFGHATGIASA